MLSLNGYTFSVADVLAAIVLVTALVNSIVGARKTKSDSTVAEATANEVRERTQDIILDRSTEWIDRLQKELDSCKAQLSKIQDELSVARSREQTLQMRIRELEYLRAEDREGIVTLILQLRKHDIPPAWQPDDFIPTLKPPIA